MNKLNATLQMGISGRVESLEVIRDGKVVRAIYPGKKNLILNSGLDQAAGYGLGMACAAYLAMGTGTADPAVTDTLLGNETAPYTTRPAASGYPAYDSIVRSANGADPYLYTVSKGVQTSVGQLNGVYTELGFSPFNTKGSGVLFSKFRIVDSGGNPTSIAVSSVEQLRLKYTVVIKFLPNTPQHYITTITGIAGDFGYTAVWQNLSGDGWSGIPICVGMMAATTYLGVDLGNYTAFANIGTAGSFTNPAAGTKSLEAYTPGSYERYLNAAWTVLQAVQSNGALKVSSAPANQTFWAAKFDTPIVKPDTHALTFRLKITWGRSA